MRLSELFEAYDITGTKAFWYNNVSHELIEIDIEHFYYILNNLSTFNLTKNDLVKLGIPENTLNDYYSEQMVKLPISIQSDVKVKLFSLVYENGWSRIVIQYEYYSTKDTSLYVETNKLSKIRQVVKLLSKDYHFDTLYADILNNNKYEENFRLHSYQYIDKFAITGKLPITATSLIEGISELPEYIDYRGQQKPTCNSLGNYIGNNIEAIEGFYKWFGNSKVVDEKGRPLVVYHGGSFNKDIDGTFDTTKGVHFGTLNAAQQRLYDKPVDDFINNSVIEYDNNYKAYYWKNDIVDSYDIEPEGFKSEKDAILNLQDYALGYGEVFKDDSTTITSAYLKIINPVRTKDQKNDWNNTITKIKSVGADGIVYKNEYEDKGKNSYIVLMPNQIKIL